jgi:hypothetical protein
MHKALLLLALLAPAQDDARARELAQKLEDDAFDVREQAQADLVKMGEPVLPLLRRMLSESKDRAELRLRLEAALREIETAAKARSVCPEPRLITLKADGVPVARLLEEIARQAELKIDAAAIDGTATASLDLQAMPVMRALDELCRSRDDRRWEFVDEDRVRLLKEATPSWPASYSGSFRVRTTSMRHARSTDFKTKTSSVRLVVEADCEKRVKPARGVEIEITQARDDKGSVLEIRKGEEEDDGMIVGRGGIRVNRVGMRMWAAGGNMDAASAGDTITLKGVDPAATKLSLQGVATFRFPLDRNDIRFTPPASGETREAADLRIRLDAQGNARWKLSISKAKPDGGPAGLAEDVQQRLDLESLVGVDEDGGEHKGAFMPSGDTMAARIVVVNGVVQQSVDSVSYLLQFPSLRGKAAKEIRFKFADRVLEKKVSFAFENISLP